MHVCLQLERECDDYRAWVHSQIGPLWAQLENWWDKCHTPQEERERLQACCGEFEAWWTEARREQMRSQLLAALRNETGTSETGTSENASSATSYDVCGCTAAARRPFNSA